MNLVHYEPLKMNLSTAFSWNPSLMFLQSATVSLCCPISLRITIQNEAGWWIKLSRRARCSWSLPFRWDLLWTGMAERTTNGNCSRVNASETSASRSSRWRVEYSSANLIRRKQNNNSIVSVTTNICHTTLCYRKTFFGLTRNWCLSLRVTNHRAFDWS